MNFRLYLNILSLFLIATLVVIFQYSFISLLPYPFYLINLIIPSLIFLLLIAKSSSIWIFAISSAFLLDILYFDLFALNIVSLVIIVYLMELWLRNWFTKHSIYSFLVLTAISVLVKNIFYYGALYIFSSEKLLFFNLNFWQDIFYQIFWAVILVVILFYISLKINKNLKPVFLGRRPLS